MTTSADFREQVWAVVAGVPPGCVTTYGAISAALGRPRSARMVGWALHAVPSDSELPCHRVVNRNGFLSGGWHFGHPARMKALLVAEGVPFVDEYEVDLAAVFWDPVLPAADKMDYLDDVASLDRRGVVTISGHD